MKVLGFILGVVYKILAALVNTEPVEYLAELSASQGVSQEKFNLMLERLNIS